MSRGNKNFIIMKDMKQNEDLQTRREFFKEAAKKTLPIIGAIVFASSPIITQAKESTPMGCNSNCKIACADSCYIYCEGSCKDGCKDTCKGSCSGGCNKSCKDLSTK